MAVWSVVDKNEIGSNFMLAAEQFHPAKLAVLKHLGEIQGRQIGELFYEVEEIVAPGSAQSPARLYDLTDALGNILRVGADLEEAKFLSNRKRVRTGDILVSRLRSYLKEIVVVPALEHDALVSPEFIVLRLRPESGFESGAWLLPYLLTSQVQTILQWSQTGSAHPRFNSDTLLSIKIPEAVINCASELNEFVILAHLKDKNASKNYVDAEALLLNELGFYNASFPQQKTYTAMYKEVESAERFDAEFFKPKYYALINLINRTESAVRLGDYLQTNVHRGIQPEYFENGEVTVIKSQHVGPRYIIVDDPDSNTSKEFVDAKNNKRALIHYGDVLLNSTGLNTIGRCQTMLYHLPAIVDGHISIIRPKLELDPIYLAAFLNSPAGYLQTERAWTGSSGQIELRPELIENYKVWLAPKVLQREISDMILQSNQLRESASLLIKEAIQRAEQLF